VLKVASITRAGDRMSNHNRTEWGVDSSSEDASSLALRERILALRGLGRNGAVLIPTVHPKNRITTLVEAEEI
jgi:hypothetical protein